jgi:hypothetical protein
MTSIDCANWTTVVTGLLAAIAWLWSARVPVPNFVDTTANEPGSILWIIKRQSRLSAIAAVLTAITVLAQAVAAFLKAS